MQSIYTFNDIAEMHRIYLLSLKGRTANNEYQSLKAYKND